MSFDLVIRDGLMADPDVCSFRQVSIGIRAGEIAEVRSAPLVGDETIDATGMIVSPGFVDLHCHAQSDAGYELRARDGVTTALELENGPADIASWYGARAGGTLINHGASVGHLGCRKVAVTGQPLTPHEQGLSAGAKTAEALNAAELALLLDQLRQGLDSGALGLGIGLAYAPGTTFSELTSVLGVAAQAGVPSSVHLRHTGDRGEHDSIEAMAEIIAASMLAEAAVCVCHVAQTGAGHTEILLNMMEAARGRGIDIMAEVHPYTAGSTDIDAEVFSPGFQERLGIDYSSVQLAGRADRLSAETWEAARRGGGLAYLHGVTTDDAIERSLARPFVAVASDALIQGDSGHPRSAGTNVKVLRQAARAGEDELMHALKAMTVQPARWLAGTTSQMQERATLAPHSAADVTIFDPHTVRDHSSFEHFDAAPSGIHHVLVAGTTVVRDGQVCRVRPGRAILGDVARS